MPADGQQTTSATDDVNVVKSKKLKLKSRNMPVHPKIREDHQLPEILKTLTLQNPFKLLKTLTI